VPPAGSAPPVWPPVADRDAGPPAVPESLAAALDMTAELPRYRPERPADGADGVRPQSPAAPDGVRPQSSAASDEPEQPAADGPPSEAERSAAAAAAAHEAATAQAAEAQATAAAQIAAAQARQRDVEGQYGDETMELPIFRELESAWFTTARPHSDTARPPASSEPASAATTQRFSTGVPQQASSPESMDGEESRERDTATVGAGGNPWQTAADEGWQAARAAADRPVDTTTTAGLPKRTPMAQLVPGGVDRGGNSVSRRTPEAVRGLLSAYHRGVQRGRQSTNPEETPGGQQSSQAGKEHDA
jgi:hypothetical protein